MTSDPRRSPRRKVAPLLAIIASTAIFTACSSPRESDKSRPSTTVRDGTTLPATTSAPTTSTSTTTTSVGPLAAVKGKTIAIDPGHNGLNYAHSAEINRLVNIGNQMKACDTTGTATDAGYTESSYNLDVAQRLASILQTAGATVVMTRSTNDGWGPCISTRARIGNRAAAQAAISIHADGGPTSGRGFHVIYPIAVPSLNDAIVSPSERLAVDLRDVLRTTTNMPTSTYVGTEGLIARNDLGGLNLSTVPKVLVETGNMRNAEDVALLTSPSFRQDEAQAIAEALNRFLG